MSKVTIHYDEICPFRSSEKAWAVCWGATRAERDRFVRFLPKSMVTLDENTKTIELPEWLVVEKGIEDYVD